MPWKSSGREFGMASMAFARNAVAAAANEEIKVGATIGLQHAFRVEALVATAHCRQRRHPGLSPPRQFLFGYFEMQLPCLDIERDHVTALHQRQRAADGSFWRRMQNHRA